VVIRKDNWGYWDRMGTLNWYETPPPEISKEKGKG
jgi:hypothetical protein